MVMWKKPIAEDLSPPNELRSFYMQVRLDQVLGVSLKCVANHSVCIPNDIYVVIEGVNDLFLQNMLRCVLLCVLVVADEGGLQLA